jgi:hypothetical protein
MSVDCTDKIGDKVYKVKGLDKFRMFPSDLTRSLDVFFLNFCN